MARLPRRSPVSSSSVSTPRLPDQDGHGLGPESSGWHANADLSVGERGARRSPESEAPGDGVELDAAIDSMLAAGGVDAVTRVRLGEARRAIAEGARADDDAGAGGGSLSQALFRFVMPRLRHPEVLRADRHRVLLEDLAEGLATTADDGVVRDGALVIHRELRRLALLRAGRNALVEG